MKKLLSTAVVLLVLMLSVSTAFAEGTVYNIDGKQVNAGDVITYAVSLEDIKNDIMAINAHVVYDDSVLSLVSGNAEQDSIVFGKAIEAGVVYNEALENRFLFNAASGADHLHFEDDNSVVTLTFLVNDVPEKAESDITLQFEFIEIYNTDSVTMHEGTDYTIKAVTDVNTYTGDMELVDKAKGSINAEPSTTASAQNSGTAQNSGNNNPSIQDVEQASQSSTIIIICVVIGVLLVGIVFILILGKRREGADID